MIKLMQGDCLQSMSELEDKIVHCCVTSPPYYGLRDYGVEGQAGLEATPEEYIANMVNVFREVNRVLRDDGTLWLNIGDSYAANRSYQVSDGKHKSHDFGGSNASKVPAGMKSKDLIGIPWMLAFALRADGWYLRQEIIWHKPNPMPESVKDRCTKAHESIFLLSKSPKYYFDSEAIKEPIAESSKQRLSQDVSGQQGSSRVPGKTNGNMKAVGDSETRNKRSVWTVTTKPYKGAHFATFPPDLIEPCILAGCPEGGTVIDPFGGSGTVAGVAVKHRRKSIICELNNDYHKLMPARISAISGIKIDDSYFKIAQERIAAA